MFPSESLASASGRKDSVMGIKIMSHMEVDCDFSLLVPSTFLPVHRVFTEREAVTSAGCARCSSWSLQVLCYCSCTEHYLMWLGKGGSREDRGLLSSVMGFAQVSVAAISRVRCFAFGGGISSMAPTGVAQLFIHPKNTTLSFPPP